MPKRIRQPAFTLVELMISIAMVVILMLGITKVFSLTSQTASATNQVSAGLRDARAAQAELTLDLSATVTDGAPFMILRSVARPAFRNKADRDSDRDYDPSVTPQANRWPRMLTVDLDGNNQEGEPTVTGEIIPTTTYNYRNHRLDILSFFSRHRFARQTGGVGSAGPLISQMTSNEAWVWYGHLWLPDNKNVWPFPTPGTPPAPSTTFPGESDVNPEAINPNNYYASQWMLGRVATLLTLPGSSPSVPAGFEASIVDRNSTPPTQRFFVTDLGLLPMSPLQAGSYDTDAIKKSSTATTRPSATARLESSRYDLAGTSVDTYRVQLYNWIIDPTHVGAAANWWDRIMCGDCIPVPASDSPTGLSGGRFQASPFFSSIQADTLARQSPIFLRGCTQFIVEFAGDFFNQDTNPQSPTYGQVLNAYFYPDPAVPSTDGQIDFVVTWDDTINPNGVIDPAEQATVKKKIRWYGMPRNTDGGPNAYLTNVVHGGVPTIGIPGFPSSSTGRPNSNDLTDVVPIGDVMFSAANSTATTASTPPASCNFSTGFQTEMKKKGAAASFHAMPMERVTLEDPTDTTLPGYPNYAATDGTGLPAGANYCCAWGPSDRKPKMIRILMTLDDPASKLPEGQTFEYVFTLP